MGSRTARRIGIIFVLFFLAATAGRLAAQEETPAPSPPASGGVLGTPPEEAPDSTPVIEHPPENEPLHDEPEARDAVGEAVAENAQAAAVETAVSSPKRYPLTIIVSDIVLPHGLTLE